jgi:hypothetical protein
MTNPLPNLPGWQFHRRIRTVPWSLPDPLLYGQISDTVSGKMRAILCQ